MSGDQVVAVERIVQELLQRRADRTERKRLLRALVRCTEDLPDEVVETVLRRLMERIQG